MARPGVVSQRIRRAMEWVINSRTAGKLCSASWTSRQGPLCRPVVSGSREHVPSTGIRRISGCELRSWNSKDRRGSCPWVGTEPDKWKCGRSKGTGCGTGDGLISSSRARRDQLCRFAARHETIDGFGCRRGARQKLRASCDSGHRWIASWRNEFQQRHQSDVQPFCIGAG